MLVASTSMPSSPNHSSPHFSMQSRQHHNQSPAEPTEAQCDVFNKPSYVHDGELEASNCSQKNSRYTYSWSNRKVFSEFVSRLQRFVLFQETHPPGSTTNSDSSFDIPGRRFSCDISTPSHHIQDKEHVATGCPNTESNDVNRQRPVSLEISRTKPAKVKSNQHMSAFNILPSLIPIKKQKVPTIIISPPTPTPTIDFTEPQQRRYKGTPPTNIIPKNDLWIPERTYSLPGYSNFQKNNDDSWGDDDDEDTLHECDFESFS
ncbi:hypothetical protein HDU76_004946 [Blyttiomyces sp. JEL0837]|nr:hypothetical protein HDU76_004946 [Blyttiomyces sp. JEL0837]